MKTIRILLLCTTLGPAAILLAGGEQGDLSREINASDCLAWTVETYRIEERLAELGLGYEDEYAALVACVRHDTGRMKPVIPIGWCDNVLKIHCSALDLLTEIGEAEIGRCEGWLGEELGIDPRGHRAWRRCGESAIFERFSEGGESGSPAACRTALLEACGKEIDPDAELPAETRHFVECCSAPAIGPVDREAGRCSMIDEGFERGPCLDRPACVNRETSEWLSCAE